MPFVDDFDFWKFVQVPEMHKPDECGNSYWDTISFQILGYNVFSNFGNNNCINIVGMKQNIFTSDF